MASDTSREGLRREVLRRSHSLTLSEYNFLQGIVANGTEVEVLLVQKRLQDPSLCFDVNADEVQDDDVLDPNDGSADFETTFDDVSPPVSKKIKTPTDEPSLVPLTKDAKDPIQETVHSSTSDWHNIVADNPRRREIILAM